MANYLNVPNASGASTPNQAGLAAGTTSIDLRVETAPNSWTGSNQALCVQYIAGGASGTRFWFGIVSSGALEYDFYNNTPSTVISTSTTTTGFTAGSLHGVRVLHNIAAGTCDFYTSPDFTVWTSLGVQLTGLSTVTESVAGTSPIVRVGTDPDNEHLPGRITKVQVLINGATILNENFTTATLGAGPWVATSGETWTALGTATVLASATNAAGSLLLLGVGA